jgi:ABC-2 type transport system permease protein
MSQRSRQARKVRLARNGLARAAVGAVAHSEAEMDHWMRSGEVLFGIEIPSGFERGVRRGDRPALLLAADATDPVASGTALAALEGIIGTAFTREPGATRNHASFRPVRNPPASTLQPGGRDEPQRRN